VGLSEEKDHHKGGREISSVTRNLITFKVLKSGVGVRISIYQKLI